MADARKIPYRDALRRVLGSGVEDYTGLYEVVWELNAAYEDLSLGCKQEAASAAVGAALGKHWIRLYRYTWEPEDRYVEVPESEISNLLASPTSWDPDCGGTRIVFAATAEGEQAYYEHGKNAE